MSQNTLAVVALGTGIVSWKAPRQLKLLGGCMSASSIAVVVSENPSLTAADVAAGGVFDQLIAYFPQGAGTAPRGFTPFLFSLEQGQSVYFAFSSAGAIAILYD
jgi:hypothetical protein